MANRDHVALELETSESRRGRSPRRSRRDIEAAADDAEPFIGTNPVARSNPPIAEREDDDDDQDDEVPFTGDARPGVDDALLPPSRPSSRSPSRPPSKPREFPQAPREESDINPNGFLPYPNPRDTDPNIVMINGVPTELPDFNAYQHKKTLAQGMMDLALLSANANQLRYVLESYQRHPYFYASLIFISISIIFQVAVGIGLIWNSRYNVKDRKEICKANKVNNLTVIGVFIVTLVNVFISAFGVADPPPEMQA